MKNKVRHQFPHREKNKQTWNAYQNFVLKQTDSWTMRSLNTLEPAPCHVGMPWVAGGTSQSSTACVNRIPRFEPQVYRAQQKWTFHHIQQ